MKTQLSVLKSIKGVKGLLKGWPEKWKIGWYNMGSLSKRNTNSCKYLLLTIIRALFKVFSQILKEINYLKGFIVRVSNLIGVKLCKSKAKNRSNQKQIEFPNNYRIGSYFIESLSIMWKIVWVRRAVSLYQKRKWGISKVSWKETRRCSSYGKTWRKPTNNSNYKDQTSRNQSVLFLQPSTKSPKWFWNRDNNKLDTIAKSSIQKSP